MVEFGPAVRVSQGNGCHRCAGEDLLASPSREDELFRTETVWRSPPPPRPKPGPGTRIAAAVRAIWSVLWLAVALVGLPAALIAFVGWPLPRSVPSGGDLLAALSREQLLTTDVLVKALACLLWLGWAATVLAVTAVVVAAVTRVRVPRLPVPRLLQAALTGLVGSVTVAAGQTGAAAAPPAATASVDPLARPADAAPVVDGAAVASSTEIAAAPTGATRPPHHRVAAGDTLWDIADRRLGDPLRWREIYRLNRGIPQADGRTLHDPDLIQVGWRLRLPAVDDGRTDQPGAPSPDPPTAVTPPAPVEPPAPTAPPPTSNPATPPEADRDADPASDRPGWIALPGGWITAGFGATLAALAAAVWHQRRRRYRPVSITAAQLDDADLRPPLHALPAIKRALRQQPELPAAAEAGETADGVAAAGQTTADGVAAAGWPAMGASGTGLDGPAADDAARGLLATLLADVAEGAASVVVPAATLTRLGLEAPATPRLIVTATVSDALTHIEEEVIRRSRHLADRDAEASTDDGPADGLAPVLLLADVPDEQWHNRLTTALQLGEPMAIHAVLVGRGPPRRPVVVAADGATDEGGHLAVLDQRTAADILALVGAAADLRVQDTADTPAPPAQQQPAAPVSDDRPPSDDRGPADTAPPAATVVRVRVLGQPAVLDRDGRPVSGLRAKSLELLVYLAVHRRGAPLSDVMEALWPEASMKRAPQRLSTSAGNLRGVIRGVAAAPTADPDARAALQPVVNTGGRYHLNPDLLDVDWWRVLDAYAEVSPADDESVKLRHLRAAISAGGTGLLAEGLDYEWIDTDREHVRRHLVQVYAHASALLGPSDPAEARRLVDTAADLDPLSEELACRAMRAAADADDPAAVRRRLETIRRHLGQAGMTLDPHTAQLAATLRRIANTK